MENIRKSVLIIAVLLACLPASGQEEAEIMHLREITFGRHIRGERRNPEGVQWRVVVLAFWGVNNRASIDTLPILANWQEEYGDSGLVVIAQQLQQAGDGAIVRVCNDNNVNFTVQAEGVIEGRTVRLMPFIIIFNQYGESVWIGSPADAEAAIMLKRTLESGPVVLLQERELAKLNHLADALRRCEPLPAVLAQAERLQEDKDPDTADEAKFIAEKLGDFGRHQVAKALQLKTSDPTSCKPELERIQKLYEGTSVAAAAKEAIQGLRNDPQYIGEMRAYAMLDQLKVLEGRLYIVRGRTLTDDFRRRNQTVLNQMSAHIQSMRRSCAECKATAEAIELGKKYGI